MKVQIQKQFQCQQPDECMEKMWYIHTAEYCSSVKGGWNLAICDNTGVPWGHYAKWNKSDRERQIPYDFIYMWNLRKKTSEQTKQNAQARNTEWWLPQIEDVSGPGRRVRGQEAQTDNKTRSRGCSVQQGGCSQWERSGHLKGAQTASLKCPITGEKYPL